MITRKYHNVPIFHFENLFKQTGTFHFISTRTGGYSLPPYDQFNFGYSVGDKAESIEKNKKILSEIVGIQKDHFLFPKQVHGDKIYKIVKKDDQHEINKGYDGLITNKPGYVLCVKGADCVPLVFCDPEERVVGVAHAGWKGTYARIGQKMIQEMIKSYHSKPENILVGIGPSISQQNYEVSKDLADKFIAGFNHTVVQVKNEKFLLNLWGANKLQLLQSGVPEENIEISGLCTYENPDIFYSHRFHKGSTGRFVVGIQIR